MREGVSIENSRSEKGSPTHGLARASRVIGAVSHGRRPVGPLPASCDGNQSTQRSGPELLGLESEQLSEQLGLESEQLGEQLGLESEQLGEQLGLESEQLGLESELLGEQLGLESEADRTLRHVLNGLRGPYWILWGLEL